MQALVIICRKSDKIHQSWESPQSLQRSVEISICASVQEQQRGGYVNRENVVILLRV
jgi:hypothetical protein